MRLKLFALAILIGWAVPAIAQGIGGGITGTATDSSGGVLPGVTITVTATAGGLGSGQTTVTNEQGTYNSDQVARADVKLEIGSLSEGVTVSGEAPLLDTSTALKQTVISRDVLEALPNLTDVWSTGTNQMHGGAMYNGTFGPLAGAEL